MSTEHRNEPSSRSMERLRTALKRISRQTLRLAVAIGTLPYHRFYYFNTLGIIQRVALYGSQPSKFDNLLRLLVRWRERKLGELQFVSIACAVLAGAVIGSFSWQGAFSSYWLALASWYSSLFLAVLGMLLSTQQIAVLNVLGELPRSSEAPNAYHAVQRYLPLLVSGSGPLKLDKESQRSSMDQAGAYTPRWKMVFTWQAPVMFMSYSVCFFLAGLTLFVITPLIRLKEHGWGTDANTAIFYLAVATVATTVFVSCAFWVYHYVDIDLDALLDLDQTQYVRAPSFPMQSAPGVVDVSRS